MATTARRTRAKSVSFSITAPRASKVSVAGSFNNWNASSTPLKRASKEGLWQRELDLDPGKYEYKFVIDGNWINDPSNKKTVRNPFGTENSLIEV